MSGWGFEGDSLYGGMAKYGALIGMAKGIKGIREGKLNSDGSLVAAPTAATVIAPLGDPNAAANTNRAGVLSRGRQSTLLTGGGGVSDETNNKRKSLLGE